MTLNDLEGHSRVLSNAISRTLVRQCWQDFSYTSAFGLNSLFMTFIARRYASAVGLYAMALCPGCLSVTSRYCIETAEQTELVFRYRSSPRLILHRVVRKFRCVQHWNTSLWNFVPNSELSHFFCFFATERRPSRKWCQHSSTVVGVSHWASTFVDNIRGSRGSSGRAEPLTL